MTKPSREDLIATLKSAGAAHHNYESQFLKGERDADWAGWYAAYTLGRLSDFASPSELTGWLAEAQGDDWATAAAHVVLQRLA